ncbi:iron reductase domain protein [Hypoxylon argillaceum]|nr:iron reductase domain protein [Hypoxylon argillaceum]KAI1154830.1 iron reductase domain protein [Nemania diffusa]
MQRFLASAVLSAFTYSTLCAASTVSSCPTNNVCYQVGVPEASASSGSGDIYFQLKAPTSYTWVALGTGSQMSGANIFVMYTDGAGNVTVSARKGTGHTEPQHQTTTSLQLLAGSGVADNTMVANVRCANCQSWDGGSMSLSSSGAPFIAAWKSGSSLNSKSLTATISMHDSHNQFTFDLTKATLADDTNPFVAASSGGSGSGTTTTSPGSSSTSGSDSGSSSGSSLPAWVREIPTLESAHGILMSIVMVILYPLGSILMPLFGSWVLHAVWQIGSFLAMWAAFALGVVLAQRTGYNFSENHTLLGTVVVALFGVQPIGGYLHHLYYVKHQKRGLVSHGHIWYGRILIVLGIINGGLGLQLAGARQSLVIAYSVVAAVIFAAYMGAAVFGEIKKHRRPGTNGGRKGSA